MLTDDKTSSHLRDGPALDEDTVQRRIRPREKRWQQASDASHGSATWTCRSATLLSTLLLLSIVSPAHVQAQRCLPLAGSTLCPAFSAASISTDQGLVASFPFLAFVSDTRDFDQQLKQYIETDYARLKYGQLFGCANLNLSDTSGLYARFTASNICSSIVQNSRRPCSLSNENSRPLCADSCAQYATSEQQIVSDNRTCSSPSSSATDQIRADFTVCSLPAESLSDECVLGSQNEAVNCGFAGNLVGLCAYCAKTSPNATDTCCYASNVATRCDGVTLPNFTALPPLFPTPTNTSNPPDSNITAASSRSGGLSTGALAGIIVGSILGAILLAGLVIFCLYLRRKRAARGASVFNQPSPPRRGQPAMVFNPVATAAPSNGGYEVLPGGRIARMSALERYSRDSSSPSNYGGPEIRRQGANYSSSDEYGDSPESRVHVGRAPLQPPPTGRRQGSLSSGTGPLGKEGSKSPPLASGNDSSSPAAIGSQQSEQLPSFKDYYSTDEIHPGDKVATLWEYRPRAPDEFELEKGDMLRVVGIWDDGWATGVRLKEKAEDWRSKRKAQRESRTSNGSGNGSSSESEEVKAFPVGVL